MFNSTRLPRLSKPASTVKANNFSDKDKLSEIVHPKFDNKSEIKDIKQDKFKRNINLVKQSVPFKNSFSVASPLVNAKRIRTTETTIAIRNDKSQNMFKIPAELPKLDTKKSLNFSKSDIIQFNSRLTIPETRPNDKLSSNPFSVVKNNNAVPQRNAIFPTNRNQNKTRITNARNSQFPTNGINNNTINGESVNQAYNESLGNILQFKESLCKTIDQTDSMIINIDVLLIEISKLVPQQLQEEQ